MVSVRDARVHEDHPLLGIVVIDLAKAFHSHGASRFNDFYPIAGGIGYGRMRISIVFRSVQLQSPQQSLGWDWGTVEVSPRITASKSDFPSELGGCRIKVRTSMGKGSLWSVGSKSEEPDGKLVWSSRKDRPIRVPVRKRYSAALIFEFRSARLLLPDQSSAFAVLWLQNIPDEDDTELDLPVFRGDIKRAEANVLPEEKVGERVGGLNVRLRFWRGVGRWHGKLAHKSPDVANVMECLICARDEGLIEESLVGDPEWLDSRRKGNGDTKDAYAGDDDIDNDDDSDSSESDVSDSGDGGMYDGAINGTTRVCAITEAESASSKGKDGLIGGLKSYKRKQDQLHRRHVGLHITLRMRRIY